MPDHGASPATAIRRSPGRLSFSDRFLRGVIGFLISFVLLELVSRAEFISPQYLPPFSHSVATGARLLFDPEFLWALVDTLRIASMGLLLTIIGAIALGILLGVSDRVFEASKVLLEFIRQVPAVAVVPVAILALGSGDSMKMALIMFSASWPIVFNTMYGVHSTDKLAKETARSFGMSRLRIVWSVVFPSALPLAYTGIRLGATIALLMTIALELLTGGGNGVGGWLARIGESYDKADHLFGGVMILGLVGLIINFLLVQGGRWLFGWHVSVREAS